MKTASKISLRSLIGLNAVNFFLGAVSSGVGPFLAIYLKEKQWSYSQIGVAMATIGIGTMIFQIPAGYLCDSIKHPKRLLAGPMLVLAAVYFIFPHSVSHVALANGLLFAAGAINALFYPTMITLALLLVGRRRFGGVMGQNQSWNHIGTIAFAAAAIFVIKGRDVQSIFAMIAIFSLMVIFSSAMIGLKANSERAGVSGSGSLKKMFSRATIVLLVAVLLFQIANAPMTPMLGLYLKKLGGSDDVIAWAVLLSQGAMIPAAAWAGHYAEKIGKRKILVLSFCVLPVRLLLCALTTNQTALLATQLLDGVGSGVQGVAVPLVCRELVGSGGRVNLLIGVVQTAVAVGAFGGSLAQGALVDSAGFRTTFIVFAAISAVGALVFSSSQKTKISQPAPSSSWCHYSNHRRAPSPDNG